MKNNSALSQNRQYQERLLSSFAPGMDKEKHDKTSRDEIYRKKVASTPELLRRYEELDDKWSTQKEQMKNTIYHRKSVSCAKPQRYPSLKRRMPRSSHLIEKKSSNESYLEWLHRNEPLTPSAALERRLAYNPHGKWRWKSRLGALSSKRSDSKHDHLLKSTRPKMTPIADNLTVSTVASSEWDFEKSHWTEPIQKKRLDFSSCEHYGIQSLSTRLGPVFDGEHCKEKTEVQRLRPDRQESDFAKDETELENELQHINIFTNRKGESYLGNIGSSSSDDSGKGFGVFLSDYAGHRYAGEVYKDLRHGYGISSYKKKGKYCGQFLNDEKHGLGTYTFPDSSFYHGDFNNGNIDGKGTLCFGSGNFYTGEWKAGLREGEGIEKNGDLLYKGQFKKGKRHGNGYLVNIKLKGVTVCTGRWEYGVFCGQGVYAESTNKI